PGEPLPPVVELRRERRPAKPARLPGGIVRVLERRLAKRGRPPGVEGTVEGAQLAPQDAHRPAVEGDVVTEEEQVVLLPAEPQEQGPRHRAAAEVEGAPRLPRRQPARLRLGGRGG